MASQPAEEHMQEQQSKQQRPYSEFPQRQQDSHKQQQKQERRRWRHQQLPSYLSSRWPRSRPRHLGSLRRRQSHAHPMVKQRENNKTITRTKAKEGCLQCSMTLIKNIRCVEDQGSEFSGDKQPLQENGGMIDDISSSKERTNSPIDHFTIPDNLGLDPPSSILPTTTPAPSKQPYAIDNPVARFEVLERLGYGSSGSSVFKARDRWDNFNTVAIKKIPLVALTDSFSLTKDYEVPQEEIDYFVSWIVDHYGDHNESLVIPVSAESALNDNDNDNSNNSSGANHGPIELPRVQQRRPPVNKENTKGLEQMVKSLGCFRNDTELWIALELCAGGSAADLIRLSDGPMTEAEIGWIMGQVLLGLAYLHSKDHVHGDIKASNILLTLDGHVKLGGSGAIMSHKEGAGERKRRRRSLTMSEFPASWLAPESNLSPSLTPTSPSDSHSDSAFLLGGDEMNDMQHYRLHAMPGASTEVDVWALGVACIELSQGRPPRPETPILASYGDWRYTTTLGNIASIADEVSVTANKPSGWCLPSEALEAVGMGMSEEMWMFIRKCLTPDPEARPTVQDLLQDPFIVQYDEMSQELLQRIGSMVDFVGQCASILEGQTLDSVGSDNTDPCSIINIPAPSPSYSITLSPSKASHMVDFKMEETDMFIPRIRPRVDSVYDESSFFDEAGLPRSVGPLESVSPLESGSSMPPAMDWKHQRMSHPKVIQALMCDQPRYLTFRHSRSPSLATIVEHQMEEDGLFWTDDESNSDDDDDDDDEDGNDDSHSHNDDDDDDDHDDDNSSSNDTISSSNADGKICKDDSLLCPANVPSMMSTSPSQQYGQQRMYSPFQKSQCQSRNQQHPWTSDHDKEEDPHAASQAAHGTYLDSLSIEPGCGLRSIVEYDFHGASSRLVVLYEIRESWLQ